MPRRRGGKWRGDGCGVSFSSLTRSGGDGVGLVASMASPRRVSRGCTYSVAGAARRRRRGSPSQNLHIDEAIGNEASLARMTAIGAVETVCFHVARAAGEVDNLGLPPPKKDK